jgi:hypothetical protein
MSEEQKSEFVIEIVVQDYKGFSIRKAKKGYLAFRGDGRGSGSQLPTCGTVEEAVASVDQYLERERQQAEQNHVRQEEREKRAREEADRQRLKTEAVRACIQPIRDFAAVHGLTMLDDCLQQLKLEEADRNLPANWEELVNKCEGIAERRQEGGGDDSPYEVSVDKYGVTETWECNSYGHDYTDEYSYGLQEYIDNFPDLVDEKEEEEEEKEED